MIRHIKDTEVLKLNPTVTKNASMQALVGPIEGWDSHVMRVVTIEPNGFTPKHQHPWPHINYVLEGTGEIEIAGVKTAVASGHYAYIPGNTLHQFQNTGKATFKFICIVPKEGHVY